MDTATKNVWWDNHLIPLKVRGELSNRQNPQNVYSLIQAVPVLQQAEEEQKKKEEEIKLREKANIRFIDWAETLFEQGLGATVELGDGDRGFGGHLAEYSEVRYTRVQSPATPKPSLVFPCALPRKH